RSPDDYSASANALHLHGADAGSPDDARIQQARTAKRICDDGVQDHVSNTDGVAVQCARSTRRWRRHVVSDCWLRLVFFFSVLLGAGQRVMGGTGSLRNEDAGSAAADAAPSGKTTTGKSAIVTVKGTDAALHAPPSHTLVTTTSTTWMTSG